MLAFIAAFDRVFVWGNYAEAALWIVLGLIILKIGRTRARFALMLSLVLFGLRDLVETRTGGWYKPPWMLAWKVACVILIIPLGRHEARNFRKS